MGGSLVLMSNCLPLSALSSTDTCRPPAIASALPNPVIEYSISLLFGSKRKQTFGNKETLIVIFMEKDRKIVINSAKHVDKRHN